MVKIFREREGAVIGYSRIIIIAVQAGGKLVSVIVSQTGGQRRTVFIESL
jgi:hypothetical protein